MTKEEAKKFLMDFIKGTEIRSFGNGLSVSASGQGIIYPPEKMTELKEDYMTMLIAFSEIIAELENNK